MPLVTLNGAPLHVEDSGGGGETIVFSHGLLWSTRLYDPQVEHFRGRYRCVAYDHRGQGQSADSTLRAIDMDTLAADAIALIESLGAGPVHFAGLSMGGFVGMRVALRRPDLLRSLILLETSADPEPAENVERYRLLNFIGRYFGLRLVAGKVMPILFGQTFLKDPVRAEERRRWRAMLVANRRSIYRAVNGVIERSSVYAQLPKLRVPTLVLVGEEDVATVPAKAERIHAAIPGSVLGRIPRAGHSSSVEEPAAVNAAIEAFLASVADAAAQAK